MTPRERREAQVRALIEDIMSHPKPEDLHKIYTGLEHYFARECTAQEIENEIRSRTKH